MQTPLEIRGINLIKYTNPCNNHCRFCSVGAKRFDDIAFERFVKVCERFIEWKNRSGRVKAISPRILYTHALMSSGQSKTFRELCARGDYNPLPLQMNGCIFMPRDDMLHLLTEHQRAGYDSFMITIAGLSATHDKWVGRKGEFKFLLSIADCAAEVGLKRLEKIFVTKTSLPQLTELTAMLDKLPGAVARNIITVNNVGWAACLDKERLTYADLECIPAELHQYINFERADDRKNLTGFKTEGEWLAWLQANDLAAEAKWTYLTIRLDEDTIDYLEGADCEAIYEAYLAKFMKAYRELPEIGELSLRYGQKDNERLYELHELERAWVSRYMAERPERFPSSYEDYILRRVFKGTASV